MWTYTYSLQFISCIIISVNYPNNMNSVKAVFLSCDKMIFSVTLLFTHHRLRQLNAFTRVKNQHQCTVSLYTCDMWSSQNQLHYELIFSFCPVLVTTCYLHTPIIKGLSKLDLCHISISDWYSKLYFHPFT